MSILEKYEKRCFLWCCAVRSAWCSDGKWNLSSTAGHVSQFLPDCKASHPWQEGHS